jgi:hypothetical protein
MSSKRSRPPNALDSGTDLAATCILVCTDGKLKVSADLMRLASEPMRIALSLSKGEEKEIEVKSD